MSRWPGHGIGDRPGRDAAQLLDVQVDQVAWLVMLVAADRPAGGAVHEGQPVQLVADQHPMDGRGGHTEAGGDSGRAEPLAAAQPEDALLEAGGGPPRTPQGDAGPIDQPGLAELLVAGPPAVGGGARDAHLVGDVGDRPSRLGGDPLDQGQPSRRVSRALAWAMRPPVGAVPSDSPHLTWRPHLTSTTSMGRTPRQLGASSCRSIRSNSHRVADPAGLPGSAAAVGRPRESSSFGNRLDQYHCSRASRSRQRYP